LLLRDQAGWDSTRIAAEMHRATPLQVPLTTPVPVHVVYATAVAREDGTVVFHDDIYGHDRRLRGLLQGGYPYPAPDRRP
jgi:murein L,D-transpeptidase YcbB/YkuD